MTIAAHRGKKTSVGMETSARIGMRVLIADDQKSVGTTLATLVCHCNHEVVEVVGSGLEAIQAYTRHNPDVVLMDYWMSKLNGATACRNILAKYPTARVILVSAWAPANQLCDSGAVSLLSKPVDIERLEEALNAAVQQPAFDDGAAAPSHFPRSDSATPLGHC
jgi:two-component system chemotaxis response regulator CheY